VRVGRDVESLDQLESPPALFTHATPPHFFPHPNPDALPPRSGAIAEEQLWLGTSQGDCNYGVDASMPRIDFDQLDSAVKR
jgi:hypothetical protein